MPEDRGASSGAQPVGVIDAVAPGGVRIHAAKHLDIGRWHHS
jgi:hypothetical protein